MLNDPYTLPPNELRETLYMLLSCQSVLDPSVRYEQAAYESRMAAITALCDAISIRSLPPIETKKNAK